MTTIIDPLGTPVVIFNRGGTAIVSFTAVRQAGSPPPADPIPNVAGHIIAYIEADDNSIGQPWVSLPSGSDVGDICEVYANSLGTGDLSVFAPSGETLDGGSTVSVSVGGYFRKITATLWKRTG